MSERARQAAERIRTEVPLIEVLLHYGFAVDTRGVDREQQFPCSLHGDGNDNKPSARYYPDSGQFFCFACGTSRDAIALVREKEALQFWDAVKLLEKMFGLEPLPWSGEEERDITPEEAVHEAFNPIENSAQTLLRVEKFLTGLTTERALGPQRVAGLWEAYDRVVAFVRDGGEDSEAVSMAHKILSASKKALHPELG